MAVQRGNNNLAGSYKRVNFMDKKMKADRYGRKKKLIRTKRETMIIRAVIVLVILAAAFLVWYMIDSVVMSPVLPDTGSKNTNMNSSCDSRF